MHSKTSRDLRLRGGGSFGFVRSDGGTASGAFKLGTSYTGGLIGTSIASYGLSFDASLVARTSVETRGKNTAYYPRIHA